MFDAYAKGFRGKPFLAVEVRLQSLLSKFALQHQSARLRALDWGGEVRVGGGVGAASPLSQAQANFSSQIEVLHKWSQLEKSGALQVDVSFS